MPDIGPKGLASVSAGRTPAAASAPGVRRQWVPPLLRRILLVNALPLILLVAALLYLDQYQNGLLENEVTALREQARIYAGALGESAVRETDPDNPQLVPEIARPLLRRLTDPTPNSQAKIYSADGQVIADSRVREGAGGCDQHPAAAARRQPRPLRGHGGGDLRPVALRPAARPDGDGGHGAVRRRAGLAAGREGGTEAQLGRQRARDAALYPPHVGQPVAGDGGRADHAQPAHGRHRPAHPRRTGGGRQRWSRSACRSWACS